jgi:hypothetical protein
LKICANVFICDYFVFEMNSLESERGEPAQHAIDIANFSGSLKCADSSLLSQYVIL